MSRIPYHEPNDADKLARITASMTTDGWTGAPLVAWDDYLLTGAHRYAAAQLAGIEDRDIPVIDIRELAAEHGHDFDAICVDEDCDGIDANAALVRVLARVLTPEQRDAYGIDLH